MSRHHDLADDFTEGVMVGGGEMTRRVIMVIGTSVSWGLMIFAVGDVGIWEFAILEFA